MNSFNETPDVPTVVDASFQILKILSQNMDKPYEPCGQLGGASPCEALEAVTSSLNWSLDSLLQQRTPEIPMTPQEKRRQSLMKTLAKRKAARERLAEEARLFRTDKSQLPPLLTEYEVSMLEMQTDLAERRIKMLEKFVRRNRRLAKLTAESRTTLTEAPQ